MSGKHIKTEKPSDADLRFNPEIGGSKGTTMSGEDPTLHERENTFQGDVENETTPQGGVDPRHVGRQNK